MQTFLSRVTADFLKHYPNPKDIAVVLPSRRAIIFFKRAFAKQLNKPVLAPRFYTIEEFVSTFSGLRFKDSLSLMFTAYETYRQLPGMQHESFADFVKWGQLLINDVNEIDRYLVDATKIFAYLADAKRIEKWNLEAEPGELVQNYLKLWQVLPQFYTELQKKLLEEGEVHQGLAFRQMALETENHLENIKKAHQEYCFVGFNALNTAEERIFTTLYREKIARFYWDIDSYYFDNPIQEAGSFLRKNKLISELKDKGELWYIENHLKEDSKEIDIIAVSGLHKQATVANSLLNNHGQTPWESTAVVLADENLLMPFLNNLNKDVPALNVTMGLPIRYSPLAGFFDLIMRFQDSLKKASSDKYGNPRYHYSLWDALLAQPVFKRSFSTTQAEKLRKTIRSRNLVTLSFNDLQTHTEETFPPIWNEILDPWTSISQGFERMAKLALFLKTHHKNQNILLESLFGFYTVFNRLSALLKEHPLVNDMETALRIYRELLSGETLDIYGEPLAGLQVMGMLETRCLDFEEIIVSSVNEDILPKGQSENSLIPFDIKLEYGLPTYLEKDAVYAYHFYRLIQRAKKVHLIYNASADALGGGEPSRFINQVQMELPRANSRIKPRQLMVSEKLEPANIQETVIEKTPEVLEAIKNYLKNGMAPTYLNLYLTDPVAFYYKKVLGLEEAEEVEEIMAFNTQGNVIHNLLEEWYKPYLNEDIHPDLPFLNQKASKVEQAVITEMQKLSEQQNFTSGRNLLIKEILVEMLLNYLKTEKERLSKLKHDQLPILKGVEERLEYIFDYENTEIKIKGSADRIEIFNHLPLILDYKTGGVNATDVGMKNTEDIEEFRKNPKAVQLLMYAYLYHKNHGDSNLKAGIISLRNTKAGIMKYYRGSSYKKDEQIENSVLEAFEKFLFTIFDELLDPTLPFTNATKLNNIED